jgi:prepilin-type processing-associated H-X9-DG protein
LFVDEKELSYSSRHPGGAQVIFADGHFGFVSETIDRQAWSALGTRGRGEVIGSF